ncbi:MAG: hypothetical protein ACXWVS_07740 [Hyphomicrobium sp.]
MPFRLIEVGRRKPFEGRVSFDQARDADWCSAGLNLGMRNCSDRPNFIDLFVRRRSLPAGLGATSQKPHAEGTNTGYEKLLRFPPKWKKYSGSMPTTNVDTTMP